MRGDLPPLSHIARRPQGTAEEGEGVVAMQRLEPRHEHAEDHPAQAPGQQGQRGEVPEQDRMSGAEALAEFGKALPAAFLRIGARAAGAVEGRARQQVGVEAVEEGVPREVPGALLRYSGAPRARRWRTKYRPCTASRNAFSQLVARVSRQAVPTLKQKPSWSSPSSVTAVTWALRDVSMR
jgi:hypothetical protein